MPSIARQITRFTKKEVGYLFEHARCVFKNKAFIILSIPRQSDLGKILIIASKKVGNAPERNKIRRQIKSVFYEEKLYELPRDFAIILHKSSISIPFSELKSSLVKILTQSCERAIDQ